MLSNDMPADLLAAADTAMRSRDYRRAARLLETRLAAPGADAAIYLRLAAARRAVGDAAGALEPVREVLARNPNYFPALLMGGSLLRTLGRQGEAARAYAAALAAAPATATLPPVFRSELELARETVAREAAWRERVAGRALAASTGALDSDERERLEAFRTQILRGRDPVTGIEFTYPGLPEQGFHDPADFDGINALQAAAPTILAEFHAVAAVNAAQRVSMAAHAGGSDVDDGGPSRQWSAMPLIAEGKIVEANAALCPETLQRYLALCPPEIAGRSPNLMFSVLDPHTRIPPHRGVANTRLVIHLGLIIPPGCGIRVGDETRHWSPGRAMVFDDTLEHEAWNDSEEQRVVLLGDLWRPELSGGEREVIAGLMGSPAAA